MADVTITGLPNASALTGAERVPMDQSGTTVDAAASAIAALATKTTVGLSNVDNTSDANKPISSATQEALNAKAAAGAVGSSGLTMTAGVLGRESGTGAPVVLSLSGLSIVNGVLTVTATGSFDPASPGAIGGTTAAAGAFTALSASTSLLLPNTAGTAAGHLYQNANTLRYRDGGNVERLLLNAADNLANLGSASTARTNLGAAASGAITGSGLTMATNRLIGRSTAATGAPEEISTSGGLVLVGGVLVPGEIVKLVVSNVGETGITTGNFKSETRIDRAFVVVGVSWNCHPTAMGSAGTSDARPYIRTGAGTTSVGTKTNLLTTTNNIASLAASVHTVDATSSISGGTYSGSAGDSLGVDLMSLGTGSSGHQLTLILRYS